MLALPDSWVWDCWLVDDGHDYHVFFLFASRALGDPEARHRRAAIGHAVSSDLVTWRRVEDALVPGDEPAFDDVATWTGSTVRRPDGTWALFYTGGRRTALGIEQSIGCATSTDLMTWHKSERNPVLRTDSRWYDTLATSDTGDDACRDPWVFAEQDGSGWQMLFTARAASGPARDRGVLGHATSPDLQTWTLQPPLTTPGAGFSQFEVPQVAVVDGRTVLIFSCFGRDTAPARAATGIRAGVWVAPADGPLGPFDLASAYPLTDESRYSGRLVQLRDTQDWCLLAFRNVTPDGGFGGWIDDPARVAWSGERLVLLAG